MLAENIESERSTTGATGLFKATVRVWPSAVIASKSSNMNP